MDAELRRTSSQLRAAQRELARRQSTVDEAVQAGGEGGDDAGSLLAAAKASSAASVAAATAAAAAPHRAAVLVRLLLGLHASAPMRLASALADWRLWAQRRRGARSKAAGRERGREREAEKQRGREAEVLCLVTEIHTVEVAAASAAATLLRRVVDEREWRQAAERKQSAVDTPLALQVQANQMREALELEVLARQAAEAKAQRLHRQQAALEAQLRLANETAQRLQREQRRASGGPETQGGGRRAEELTEKRSKDRQEG